MTPLQGSDCRYYRHLYKIVEEQCIWEETLVCLTCFLLWFFLIMYWFVMICSIITLSYSVGICSMCTPLSSFVSSSLVALVFLPKLSYSHVLFLSRPVSIMRIAYRTMCEGLLSGAWAIYQWLHHWKKLSPLHTCHCTLSRIPLQFQVGMMLGSVLDRSCAVWYGCFTMHLLADVITCIFLIYYS